jgi:hypothetical protein
LTEVGDFVVMIPIVDEPQREVGRIAGVLDHGVAPLVDDADHGAVRPRGQPSHGEHATGPSRSLG